ncbi:MAG: amidohydrolase [Opitutales bacterium]|nr:amidohydrolase [Opitutales bacterium]
MTLLKNIVLNRTKCDILIDGGRFKKIARELSVPADATGTEIVDLKGECAILPGFYNTHTHAAMTLCRGYADDMELFKWLNEHIWPFEAKLKAPEDFKTGLRLAALEMIRSGTVFFNDMYFCNEQMPKVLETMGLRATLSFTFLDFQSEERRRAMIDRIKKLPFGGNAAPSGRIKFAVAPHSIYTVCEKNLLFLTDLARERGLKIHIHLAETRKEVEDCRAAHNTTPVRYLEKLGILGNDVVAAHVVHVDDEEIAILRERGVTVSHNPVSNMKLSSGVFRSQAFLKAGVPVTLGTDGASSNNNLDMRESMKIAALLAKNTYSPETLAAEEIFEWATRNGARAFGLDAGEIAEGKLADAVIVDLNNERLVPHHHLVSNWVYAADSRCVRHVICDGKFLMRDGHVAGEEKIIADVRAAWGTAVK